MVVLVVIYQGWIPNPIKVVSAVLDETVVVAVVAAAVAVSVDMDPSPSPTSSSSSLFWLLLLLAAEYWSASDQSSGATANVKETTTAAGDTGAFADICGGDDDGSCSSVGRT